MKTLFQSFAINSMIMLSILAQLCAEEGFDSKLSGTVEAFTVKAGTLEITPEVERRYIFRYNGKEEVFDCRMEAIFDALARNKAVVELKFVGIIASDGNEYFSINENEFNFLTKFKVNHPKLSVNEYIFKGLTDQRVMLLANGRTPIYRVEFMIDSRLVVLWSNIPKDALPAKGADKK